MKLSSVLSFLLFCLCNVAGATNSLQHTKSPRPLVRVSYTHCCASTARLSSRWSTCGLTGLRHEGTHLGASFLLRCFQQLSPPEVATEQCRWHDNSHTSAPFSPVLSY